MDKRAGKYGRDKAPQLYTISQEDLNCFRRRVGIAGDAMSIEECRQLLDERLGDKSLSEIVVEMRRESRY